MTDQTPFQLLGGEAGVRRLAHAFYDVMDELEEAAPIRAMHAQHMDEIKEKLTEYLTGWLGGPPLYQQRHGSVCLTEPHRPYAIGPAERDQWLLCMRVALERVGASDQVKQMLEQPMFRIANAIRNREESPDPSKRDPNVIAMG